MAAGLRPVSWPASATSACSAWTEWPDEDIRLRTLAVGTGAVPHPAAGGCGAVHLSPVFCSSGSGRLCGPISTGRTSISSVTCPSMWPWTPPMCGPSRRISSWMTGASPRRCPVCRRTTSAPTASCGATPSIDWDRDAGRTASAGGSAASTAPGSLYRRHPHRPLPGLRELLGSTLRRDDGQKRPVASRAPAWRWWVCSPVGSRSLEFIAEDLGYPDPGSGASCCADSGLPGMKVLEFAFDSRDTSSYLPHSYGRELHLLYRYP